MKMDVKWISELLVGVGALNWGLALFNFNLVTAILGTVPVLVQIVYALVGISGLVVLYHMFVKK